MAGRGDENTKSSGDYLQSLPTLISGLTATGLLLSVLYDWALLSAVGLDLREVPTTVSDHVRTALLWLPSTVVGLLGYVAVESLTKRIERGLTEDEIVESSPDPPKTRRSRDRPLKVINALAFLALVSFLLWGDAVLNDWLPIVVFVAWLAFSSWVTSAPLIRLRLAPNLRFVLTFVPALLLWFMADGYVEGRQILAANEPTHEIQLIDRPEKVDLVMIRAFSEALVGLDPGTHKAQVFRWNQVTRITKREEAREWRGLLAPFIDWIRKLGEELQ